MKVIVETTVLYLKAKKKVSSGPGEVDLPKSVALDLISRNLAIDLNSTDQDALGIPENHETDPDPVVKTENDPDPADNAEPIQ